MKERKLPTVNEMNEAAVSPMAEEAQQALPASLQEMILKAVAQAVAEEKKAFQPVLSPEDEARQQLSEKEAALVQREQALSQREMRAYAREQLAARQLPDALLGALCCRDEESCIESLDKVETAFRQAVQEGVLERMRGEEPRRTAAPSLAALDDQAYYTATYQK